jgi:hypothetical protein
VRQVWPVVDPARSLAQRRAFAGVLLVRSETQLMEQLQYNLLFRWFVGLSLDDDIWERGGVHQKPRAPDRGGHCQKIHDRSA